MTNEHFLIIILIIINIFSVCIGYILGKMHQIYGVNSIAQKPISFFTKDDNKTKVSIDDTKYVINIKTENLEKKYENLGEVKKTSENISQSVNKLKNLKG
jgi:hypothetical protein